MFRITKKAKIRTAEQQLADIAEELIKQNKSASRRRMLLIIIVLLYFGGMIFIGVGQSGIIDDLLKQESPFVAEVVLVGTIAEGGDITNEGATQLLEEAFSAKNSKAIILRLNSGGGSPVQSSQIYQNIKRLKSVYNKKIYVVVDDICASGCYYIASIADGIYANKSSIIGSIGVVITGFGVTDTMEKIGIKRRLYTSGDHKGMLDPFSTENQYAVNHIQQQILNISHQNFIDAVKAGRGTKLSNNKDLFSGLVWLGDEAKKLGLIDGIGDSYFVASEIIGVKSRIKYSVPKTFIEQFTKISFNLLSSQKNIKLQ